MQPSPEITARLQPRYAQLQEADLQGLRLDTGFWIYLQASENQLIDLMSGNPPGPNAPGSLEFSWALYFLNHRAPSCITDLLRRWGMPESKITPEDWSEWEKVLNNQGVLYGDGSLVSTAKYAVVDAGWSLALLDYMLFRLGLRTRHVFGTKPKTLSVTGQSSLRIALFGDWGTGNYSDGNLSASPSQLIAGQINQASPDISIHLGDVYYSGTAGEEQDKLISCWPKAPLGNFMLNSNHEMYDGGVGYFGTSLQSSVFAGQQGTSYFQIEFGNWLILGLDSAYYDTSWLFSDGAITDPAQIAMLQAAVDSKKRIMLLSHHNPIDITGATPGILWTQVLGAMGKTHPDYWYWGHQHNGVVYPTGGVTGSVACRCLGNAAIPIGNASWLANNPNVSAYTNKPLANPTPQQGLRVMNGYAILEFGLDTVSEQWYYQDGSAVTI